MTGRAYAVASGKGGVGKTTTVVNLGVMLRVAGHDVAVVDADLGMANMAAFLGVEHEPTLHDVLADEASLDEAIVEDPEGFAIVSGARALEGVAVADPTRLGDVIETLAESFDYVLVDTGAGLSHESVLPLGLTEGVLLVSTPDPVAIEDTKKTAELVDLAQGTIVGAVITRVREDTDPESIAEQLGTELMGAIPEDPAVSASIDARRPLIINAPDSDAAKAYRQLTISLTDTDVPPLEALQSMGDSESSEEQDDTGPDDSGADEEEEIETGDTAGDETDEPDEEATDEGESEREDEPVSEAESDSEESDEPAIEAAEGTPESTSGDEPEQEVSEEDERGSEAGIPSPSNEEGDATESESESDEDKKAEDDTEDTESRGGLLSRLLSPFR